MVSPEVLRKFPFFGFLDGEALSQVAMLAEEVPVEPGEDIFEAGQLADALYLLMSGRVELTTDSYDPIFRPDLRRSYLVGEINPGEAFGLSSVIPPYQLNAGARATEAGAVLRMDARKLRRLMEDDPRFSCGLYRHICEALIERLHYTRVQLAAARV